MNGATQYPKAWVATADMGYGHQRAVHPLSVISQDGIITIGNNEATPIKEQKIWKRMLRIYEWISRAKEIPIIGRRVFKLLDIFLEIPPFYPIRNLSKPTFQVYMLKKMINKGLCQGLIGKAASLPEVPIITSFYAPAIAADKNSPNQTYCIICDADLNRVWVAENPEYSQINYFAPCFKAKQRLESYGVQKKNIFLTGFPFSLELLGDKSLSHLRADLAQRLFYLDPYSRFWSLHSKSVEHFLGAENCIFKNDRILTILYAVGGAGAQASIGVKIAKSLAKKIRAKKVKLILSAGIRKEVKDLFDQVKDELELAEGLEVLYSEDKNSYFRVFDQAIRKTDILWTKPSELTFFCGLGLPIVMTPALGAQERFNKKWLYEIQAGFKQDKPKYCHQWLFDLLNSGRLAEAAWSGFLKARKCGTYKIFEVLETGKIQKSMSPLER